MCWLKDIYQINWRWVQPYWAETSSSGLKQLIPHLTFHAYWKINIKNWLFHALSLVLKWNCFLKGYREASCGPWLLCSLFVPSCSLDSYEYSPGNKYRSSPVPIQPELNFHPLHTQICVPFMYCLTICNIIPLPCCLPEPCQLSLINPNKLASWVGTDPTHRSNCEFDGKVLQWSIFKYNVVCFQYPIMLSLASLCVICVFSSCFCFLSLNITLS